MLEVKTHTHTHTLQHAYEKITIILYFDITFSSYETFQN